MMFLFSTRYNYPTLNSTNFHLPSKAPDKDRRYRYVGNALMNAFDRFRLAHDGKTRTRDAADLGPDLGEAATNHDEKRVGTRGNCCLCHSVGDKLTEIET